MDRPQAQALWLAVVLQTLALWSCWPPVHHAGPSMCWLRGEHTQPQSLAGRLQEARKERTGQPEKMTAVNGPARYLVEQCLPHACRHFDSTWPSYLSWKGVLFAQMQLSRSLILIPVSSLIGQCFRVSESECQLHEARMGRSCATQVPPTHNVR